MTEELNFTITEPLNPKEILEETKEIIHFSDLELGSITTGSKKNDLNKIQLIESIQALEKDLDKDQAFFSEKLDVYLLSKKDFKSCGISMSNELKAKMEKYNFYQVGIPITLFPRSGWAFTRLECEVIFCQDEKDPHQLPIIYEMFPESVWAEILHYQNRLNLGLDAKLTYKAQAEIKEKKIQKLSHTARAKLDFASEQKSKFVVGPFSYHFRRAQIRTSGRLGSRGFWRLDNKKRVDEEDVLLSVVLTVPKDRKKIVNVAGKLKAYHNFQMLTSDLKKDWPKYLKFYFKYFRPNVKAFFEGGAYISSEIKWKDIMRSSY